MLKIYRIELKRSPLLLAIPVLIAVDVIVLFGRSRHWIGVWPEASAAAQIVTIFLGPVLAGVSAWQAGRSSRAEMPEFLLAAARAGWKAEAVRLAATLTMGLFSYGIGVLIAIIVSWSQAGTGFIWPSYVVLGAGTLISFAAVGHVAGRWWPSPLFTPVICALVGFILLLSLGQGYGLFVISGPPTQIVQPAPLVIRFLLGISLALLAVTVPDTPTWHERVLQRSLSRAQQATVTVTALCSVGLIVAIPFLGSLRAERDPSKVEVICERASENAPQVCVWPEHRKYLGELATMAKRLHDIPQNWVQTPSAFYEEGLRPTRLGDVGFSIIEGHVRSAAIAMAGQVSAVSFKRCLPPGSDAAAWQASDRIDFWLEYRAMGQDPEVADQGLHVADIGGAQGDAATIVRLPEEDQEDLISAQRAVLRKSGCDA